MTAAHFISEVSDIMSAGELTKEEIKQLTVLYDRLREGWAHELAQWVEKKKGASPNDK